MSASGTAIHLSLISHTNAGKTTLARTLLGRDVGEVRDAPHVTDEADASIRARDGRRRLLMLWDTPGFGDSARLARRLRHAGNPHRLVPVAGVGPLRATARSGRSQQAVRNVRDRPTWCSTS